MSTARLLVAAAFALLLGSASAAAQENWTTWTDATNALTFQYPATWTTRQQQTDIEGAIGVFTGAGDYECQIWSLPHAGSEAASAAAVRERYAHPLSESDWREIAGALSDFQDGLAISQEGIDVSGAWPIQHVTLTSGAHHGRGTIQGRPGRELISICQSYDNQDRSEKFAAIERSIGAPSDPAPSTTAP